MKNYIPFVFILLYVMISCQQEIDMPLYNNSVSEISSIDYSRSIEEDSLLITELGYQVRKIEEFDTYYIVNDVRLFKKEDIISYLEKNPATKLKYDFSVMLKAQKISINLENYGEYDTEELDRLQYAIDQWNSLRGSNVFFCMNDDSSINHSDWHITTIHSYGDYDAHNQTSMILVTTPLGEDYPSPSIYLDRKKSAWKNASDEQKKYAYMHMLGLIVGLSDKETGGTQIAGTMIYDSQSIMRSHTYLQSNPNDCWSGFSSFDRTDIPLHFPLCPNDIVYSFSNMPYGIDSSYIGAGENVLTISPLYDIPVDPSDQEHLSYSIEIYNETKSEQVKYVNNTDSVTAEYEDGCTYKITVIVKNENGLGELDRFKKFVICRSGDIQFDGPLAMPLSLDKFFQLNFTISAVNPDLEFSAYETLFDNGGNQNIVVEKVSNNKLRFKLLDYGAYCIKVWPVGFEDRASKIIIEKYSRPSYEVSDTEWLEDLEGTAYDIVAQCDTTIFIPSKTSQYVTGIRDSLTVRIGNSPVLQERFYAKAYLKYFYNSYLYIGENMNMCHSLYRVGVEDIVLQKGEDSLYNLPEVINFRYTQGNRVHDYFGYYAVVIPPDRFEFIGYDSDSDNLNN